ncbi:TIGR03016 family PEP-CTERM system-associated outer membrane protein [Ectothiorhodospira variabilis]|uniref:TIGR03016 family PEP-CTERM system-associated outer membrane protein n=1 Tax=Ectothiorhodospira variabilis TaxID=505694 RepID=UPI001EFB9C54|nr:TIGR03016 family PEP-CTERM system-associated outer membrane protein [Ectothiorhodospira variabilis]MCG5494779.1 TIGR03016 family PEP-CTERM system-associated outer membrane protein [Ectothiorhodospira variabilis]MCG5504332.1 TIGR03016 family PEP-CTERM system-associated outer membrane protein [Ectothiorhodospira variabilis]MCG5507487.1 TIGR03016 family PEP-CTERM system-associated outer membrane protein [Ectothiorhodospira variabilis]
MNPPWSGALLGGAAVLFLSADASANRWDFTPRVSVSQTYTDNVNLASSSDDKESESVSQLNTGFSLSRDGGRTDLSLGYNLRGLAYWGDDSRNTVNHTFSGNSNTELLRETFFVDASASYRERLVDGRDGFADDTLTDGNRTGVATYRVSPYWRQQFGRFAGGEVRYSWDKTDYQDASVEGSGSESNRVQASLDSGPQFTTIGWGITYNWNQVDFEDGSRTTFESVEGLVRLNLTPQFSVFAAGGEERNDFQRDAGTDDPNDSFWRAGATWLPTPRTSLDAFYGERFFGDTYGLTLNHRARHATWSIAYSETVDVRREGQVVDLIAPEDDGPPDTRTAITRQLSVSASGQRSKVSWTVSGSRQERDFQQGDDQKVNTLTTSASYQLAPRTSAQASLQWQGTDYDVDNRKDDLYALSLGLSRTLGPRTSASLTYRHQQRDSNLPGGDYEENRVTATLSATF